MFPVIRQQVGNAFVDTVHYVLADLGNALGHSAYFQSVHWAFPDLEVREVQLVFQVIGMGAVLLLLGFGNLEGVYWEGELLLFEEHSAYQFGQSPVDSVVTEEQVVVLAKLLLLGQFFVFLV